MNTTDKLPWFKQPLVWMVIAIPAVSVVVGLALLVFSLRIDLGLVSDDYYQRGKAINADLSKDKRARALGYRGAISYDKTQPAVAVVITSATAAKLPAVVTLDIMHATRGGLDIQRRLRADSPGFFQAALAAPLPHGAWEIRLRAEDWRIHGRLQLPQASGTTLMPR